MNGRTNTQPGRRAVRANIAVTTLVHLKTCLCAVTHSLTYLFEKGEMLLSKLALALPVMPHSTDCVCLPQSEMFLVTFETRCGSQEFLHMNPLTCW